MKLSDLDFDHSAQTGRQLCMMEVFPPNFNFVCVTFLPFWI